MRNRKNRNTRSNMSREFKVISCIVRVQLVSPLHACTHAANGRSVAPAISLSPFFFLSLSLSSTFSLLTPSRDIAFGILARSRLLSRARDVRFTEAISTFGLRTQRSLMNQSIARRLHREFPYSGVFKPEANETYSHIRFWGVRLREKLDYDSPYSLAL